MHNQYVPYEIAVALKEKGFVEECIYHLHFMNDVYASTKEPMQPSFWLSHNEALESPVTREELQRDFKGQLFVELGFPLYQQVTDWFRRKHRLCINVTFREFEGNKLEGINSVYFDIEIYRLDGGDAYKELKVMEWSDHYYVCLIKGINEALKLI